ncbi:hypothetical protein G3I28_33615, partial [Streptomyces sp. SID10116]|nr:hypothetical protein [Streptomyces sp. SID10116]
ETVRGLTEPPAHGHPVPADDDEPASAEPSADLAAASAAEVLDFVTRNLGISITGDAMTGDAGTGMTGTGTTGTGTTPDTYATDQS